MLRVYQVCLRCRLKIGGIARTGAMIVGTIAGIGAMIGAMIGGIIAVTVETIAGITETATIGRRRKGFGMG